MRKKKQDSKAEIKAEVPASPIPIILPIEPSESSDIPLAPAIIRSTPVWFLTPNGWDKA
jgi:hypothetical protein